MNRSELASRVATGLRAQGIVKKVCIPAHAFTISDDSGNSKKFKVAKDDKEVAYTAADVDAIIGALIDIIADHLKTGDEISIRGLGTFGLKYRAPRKTKLPGTSEWVNVPGRYVPKFSPGDKLKQGVRVYEAVVTNKAAHTPLPIFDDDTDDVSGGHGDA